MISVNFSFYLPHVIQSFPKVQQIRKHQRMLSIKHRRQVNHTLMLLTMNVLDYISQTKVL
jgi:hypothetical protein